MSQPPSPPMLAKDPTPKDPTSKGLKAGSIGIGPTVALGLAAVAPAYSLAVTLGFVVLAVGASTPAAFLLGFVPILFTALAFRDLNKEMPDCGGVFVWITRVFGPAAGWFLGGWVPQMATFIASAALAQVATTYLLNFLGLAWIAAEPIAVAAIACGLIALSAWIAARGIELSAWVQYALIALQLVALGGFCVAAFTAMATGTSAGTAEGGAEQPSLDWFNPFASGDMSGLVSGVILCLFIYWGWDALIAVNEETTDRKGTPGKAVVITTVILLFFYVVTATAAVGFAGTAGITNPDTVSDVLSVLGPQATGEVFGQVIMLAVGLSALAALMTVAVSTPRTWLSMGTYGALHRATTTMHSKRGTPTISIIWWAVITMAITLGLTAVSADFIGLAILSVGLMIAAYYAATALASVVYFAPQMRGSASTLVLKGILPGLGALLMIGAFAYSAVDMLSPDYAGLSWLGIGSVFWIGIGALALGLMVTAILKPRLRRFFSGEAIPRGNVTTRHHLPAILSNETEA
ncbi:amino acid/polyamine/organocation transporter, APC superfamily [Arthrobacter sp. yr096]|uniref:APC family permease n=1 Tax=Arthrobacter sp. yr096 TaxID=1761750 RepID=UPI0008CB1B99|nr:APC family permease [Arthrobacter sp. yr096]SEJ54797.1 amino acid/polyamine/organocation transporter, APC superfamily [Arthrobacter sp. yr096]